MEPILLLVLIVGDIKLLDQCALSSGNVKNLPMRFDVPVVKIEKDDNIGEATPSSQNTCGPLTWCQKVIEVAVLQ